MRIADKIANRIIEEFNIKTTKENYLDTECRLADLIADEIKKWLGYDVDLNEFQDIGLSELNLTPKGSKELKRLEKQRISELVEQLKKDIEKGTILDNKGIPYKEG